MLKQVSIDWKWLQEISSSEMQIRRKQYFLNKENIADHAHCSGNLNVFPLEFTSALTDTLSCAVIGAVTLSVEAELWIVCIAGPLWHHLLFILTRDFMLLHCDRMGQYWHVDSDCEKSFQMVSFQIMRTLCRICIIITQAPIFHLLMFFFFKSRFLLACVHFSFLCSSDYTNRIYEDYRSCVWQPISLFS